MTEDERIDAQVALFTSACHTEIGRRLTSAVAVDALCSRAAVAMGQDLDGLAKTMTRKAITELAEREVETLDAEEMTRLQDRVADHVQVTMAAATKHAWTVATMLGYGPESIQPEGIAFLAATLVIPADAGTLEDQDPDAGSSKG